MNRAKIITWIGLAIFLAGCEANPKQVDLEGRILLEGENMGHLVRIVEQSADRIEGGLLRVRTLIRNRTKEDLWVDVQVVWKDEQGFEIYRTNWAPLYLAARLETTHEVASMRGDVTDYQFRLRRTVKTTR